MRDVFRSSREHIITFSFLVSFFFNQTVEALLITEQIFFDVVVFFLLF